MASCPHKMTCQSILWKNYWIKWNWTFPFSVLFHRKSDVFPKYFVTDYRLPHFQQKVLLTDPISQKLKYSNEKIISISVSDQIKIMKQILQHFEDFHYWDKWILNRFLLKCSFEPRLCIKGRLFLCTSDRKYTICYSSVSKRTTCWHETWKSRSKL